MADALPADLKATRILFLEDRAQVERKGHCALPGGRTVCEVTGVSPAVVDRSLKVEVTGATLHDARIERRWRPRTDGLHPDASAARQRAAALEASLTEVADAQARLLARRDRVDVLEAEVGRAIGDAVGAGQRAPETWSAQLGQVSALRQAWLRDQADLGRRETEIRRELAEVSAALVTAEGPERDLEGVLVMTLEGQGTAQITAVYLVPCAAWRPAYRATLRGGTVFLEVEAVAWQRTGEQWSGVEVAFSTARPTLGTTPPRLVEDRLATRPKAAEERRHVDVALREEIIPSSGEGGTGDAPGLPGLDDGGEARVLVGLAPTEIPSDGLPHRLALQAFEAPATLERCCAPELGGAVVLVARFPNNTDQVLLAGPVDLIRESGFVGRAQLAFTAPGEIARLGFGSEDGLRVLRTVEENRDEARLTGRKTTRTVVSLFVSNASPSPAHVVLEERVPVSEVKDVEIGIITRECRPAPTQVSREGIARLEVDLPAGGTSRARFVWELAAAARVTGL